LHVTEFDFYLGNDACTENNILNVVSAVTDMKVCDVECRKRARCQQVRCL